MNNNHSHEIWSTDLDLLTDKLKGTCHCFGGSPSIPTPPPPPDVGKEQREKEAKTKKTVRETAESKRKGRVGFLSNKTGALGVSDEILGLDSNKLY